MLRGKKKKTIDGKAHFPAFFTSPEGRLILKEIEKHCDYAQDVFSIDNERVNAYNQGRQSVAIWINKVIKEQT